MTIQGKIENYTPIKSGANAKGNWAQTTMTVNGSKYSILKNGDTAYQQLQTFTTQTAPIGSLVEFESEKQGNFTNYKPGTMKVMTKGNGKAPAGSSTGGDRDDYWRNKDAREVQNYPVYLRVKAWEIASNTTTIDGAEVDKLDSRTQYLQSLVEIIHKDLLDQLEKAKPVQEPEQTTESDSSTPDAVSEAIDEDII